MTTVLPEDCRLFRRGRVQNGQIQKAAVGANLNGGNVPSIRLCHGGQCGRDQLEMSGWDWLHLLRSYPPPICKRCAVNRAPAPNIKPGLLQRPQFLSWSVASNVRISPLLPNGISISSRSKQIRMRLCAFKRVIFWRFAESSWRKLVGED